MTRALKTLTKDNLLAVLLGGVALFAVYIAQVSSNSCAAWSLEQPKIPESLIKVD